MDLYERLKEVMAEEYGIHDENELAEAVKEHEPVDLGIFRKEIKKSDEKTA